MTAFRKRSRRRFLDDLDSGAPATTVLGSGVSFVGDVASAGDAVIAGSLEGTLRAAGRVHVAVGGRVKGPLHASEAKIDGVVEGPVEVKGRVEIGAEAKIAGRIVAGRLDIAEGAQVLGEVATASAVERFEERRGAGERVP